MIITVDDWITICWIIGLSALTMYLAIVSKSRKKKIVFGLLSTIPTLLACTCILVLLEDGRCEDLAKGLPHSLESAVKSNGLIPLEFGPSDCGFQLLDALEYGAINLKDSNLRKKYTCLLYKEANNVDTIKGEILTEVTLPKVFYRNPVHSIQCLDKNKPSLFVLISGLALSLEPDFINMKGEKLNINKYKFNSLYDTLMVSKELSSKDKEKLKLLSKKVFQEFEAKQIEKEGEKMKAIGSVKVCKKPF